MLLWNTYAWSYDILTRFKPYQDLQRDVAAAIPAPKNLKVLNIGCGTGNLEFDILKERPDLQWTGLDFSVAMLGRARTKNPGCTFVQHDLTQPLPFDDGSFDVVIACNVIYATPERVLDEMRRVAGSKGLMIIADPNGPYDLKDLKKHLSGAYVQTIAPLLNPLFLVKFICFMAINLIIDRKESTGEYKYRSNEDWQKLFPGAKPKPTYAGMDWILSVPGQER